MDVSYDVRLHSRAEKELDKVPEEIFPQIDAAIWALRKNPRPMGVKKLEGDLHRIRVGSWRIIYIILDRERNVVVLRVVRRSEKTYKDL